MHGDVFPPNRCLATTWIFFIFTWSSNKCLCFVCSFVLLSPSYRRSTSLKYLHKRKRMANNTRDRIPNTRPYWKKTKTKKNKAKGKKKCARDLNELQLNFDEYTVEAEPHVVHEHTNGSHTSNRPCIEWTNRGIKKTTKIKPKSEREIKRKRERNRK